MQMIKVKTKSNSHISIEICTSVLWIRSARYGEKLMSPRVLKFGRTAAFLLSGLCLGVGVGTAPAAAGCGYGCSGYAPVAVVVQPYYQPCSCCGCGGYGGYGYAYPSLYYGAYAAGYGYGDVVVGPRYWGPRHYWGPRRWW